MKDQCKGVGVHAIVLLAIAVMGCLQGCSENPTAPRERVSNEKVYGVLATTQNYDHQFYAYRASGKGYVEWSGGGRQSINLGSQDNVFAVVAPDLGTVTFDGSTVHKNGDGATYRSLDIAVPLTGHPVSWGIAGYDPLADWAPKLATPPGDISMTAPLNAASISMSSALTIRWSASTLNTSMTVLIEILPNDSGVNASEPCRITMKDVGSHTVSAEDMGSMTPGKHTIIIKRSFFDTGIAPDGKSYVIAHFAQYSCQVKITS